MNTMDGNAGEQPISDEPKFFGEYEVLRWIGKGKFAVVYRARKVGTETMVALKRVSVDLMDEKTREKCLKEVRLLQNLDHKNIIRYLDSFILENDLIIVFEWAAAGDLKRQLRKAIERGSGFDERTIWKYFSQICDAMQHMHERRIMHRDLKPANIFLTLDGTIKVGDLGLSREMSEHTIQAHSKVGTPLYMSPEVLNGEGHDFKTDIWSLGCLLYELASLKSPFKQEGMNLYALCQKITSGDFQPLPDSYSEDLRSLAYSMISTKPADRPEIGAVCVAARRMRAETQDRRTIKKPLAALPAAAVTAAGSEAEGAQEAPASRQRQGRDSQQQLQPSTEFDIKPPTANLVSDEAAAPAQWNFEVEQEKDSTALRESKQKSQKSRRKYDNKEEEDEQTNPWRNEQKQSRERNGSGSGLRSRERQQGGQREGDRGAGGGGGLGMLSDYDYLNNNHNNDKDRERQQQQQQQQQPSVDSFVSVPFKGSQASSAAVPGVDYFDSAAAGGASQLPPSGVAAAAPRVLRKPSASSSRTSTRGEGAAAASGSGGSRPSSSQATDSDMNEKGDVTAKHAASSSGTIVSTRASAAGSNNRLKQQQQQQQSYGGPARLKEGHFAESGPAFAASELLVGRLTLLGYSTEEDGFDDLDEDGEPVRQQQQQQQQHSRSRGRGGAAHSQLLPFHFACDLQVFSVAGRESNSQFLQFRRFVCVAVWLAKRLRQRSLDEVVKSIDTSVDTPLATCKQLLRLGQLAADLQPSVEGAGQLQSLSASSLTSGYGLGVCLLLTVLADCVLASERFTARQLVYRSDTTEEVDTRGGAAGEEQEEDADVIEEDPEVGEGQRERGAPRRKGRRSSGSRQRSRDGYEEEQELEDDVDDDNHDLQSISDVYQTSFMSQGGAAAGAVGSMLFGAPIDPLLWREETERVGRVLAGRQAVLSSSASLASGEWSGRIQLLKQYADQLAGSSSSPSTAAAAARAGGVGLSDLVGGVTSLKGQLGSGLQVVRTSERSLNNQHSAAALTFAAVMSEHQQVEQRLAELRGSAGELSERLSAASEALEAVAEELKVRLDGGGGAGGDGNSRIVALNQALALIRREIKQYHITSGVLSARLTLLRCQEQAEAAHSRRAKAADRHSKRTSLK